MASAHHIARDIVRALAVLALVFLSFAHQPTGVAASLVDEVVSVAVTASFCGDAPVEKAHPPCHACRIGGGADLPPPCEGLVHLPAAGEPAFPELARKAFTVAPPAVPEARGPPLLA